MALLIAVSTNDGENLVTDDHAGQAKYFDVYSFSDDGEVEFVERRENSKYAGDESMRHGDPKKAKSSLESLGKVDAWASPRFGPNLKRLIKKVLCIVVRVETIEEALELLRGNLDRIREECAKGEERSHLVLKPQ
ncbi:MAG: hypothetical protein J7M38_03910 [Armatimonadetes bacterium]|nr:hypothetical protein [Armatimonadota bacterium]